MSETIYKMDENLRKDFTALRIARRAFSDADEALKHAIETNEKQAKIEKMEKEREKLENNLFDAERNMVKIKRGLYMGIGVNMEELSRSRKSLEPIYLDWGKLASHASIIGASGSGKTSIMFSIIDQVIERGDHIIAIDPKGGPGNEVLSQFYESCMNNDRINDLCYVTPGYPDPPISTQFNPLHGMANESIMSMSKRLVMGGGSGSMNSSNDFFGNMVLRVVGGILMGLEYLEKNGDPFGVRSNAEEIAELMRYRTYRKTNGRKLKGYDALNNVVDPDLVDRAIGQARLVTPRNAREEDRIYFSRRLVTFEDLAYYSHFDNLEKLRDAIANMPILNQETIEKLALGLEPLDDSSMSLSEMAQERARVAYNEISSIRKQALAELNSIVEGEKEFFTKTTSSIVAIFGQLSTGLVGKLFCTCRVNPLFLRFYSKTRGLACLLSPLTLKFQSVSDQIVKITMFALQDILGQISQTGRGLSRRVWLVIDEAASILYPGIEDYLNKARAMGVSIILLTQSRADFTNRLGQEGAKVVLDNVNTRFLLRHMDEHSKEEASKAAGFVSRTVQQFISGEESGRMMTTVEKIPMIQASSFDKLENGQGIVKYDGNTYLAFFPYNTGPQGEFEMPVTEWEKNMSRLSASNDRFDLATHNISVLVEDLKRQRR
jgi:ABC-type dipeptide/oligopeptide/nickel transport system ATPase component